MTKLTDEEKQARALARRLRRYAERDARNIKVGVARLAYQIEAVLEYNDDPDRSWLLPEYLEEHIPALTKILDVIAPDDKGFRSIKIEDPTEHEINRMLHIHEQQREAHLERMAAIEDEAA